VAGKIFAADDRGLKKLIFHGPEKEELLETSSSGYLKLQIRENKNSIGHHQW